MPRLSFLLILSLPVVTFAADWPQFRGPGSNGISTPEVPLPADIGPEKHVVWKTPLPPGHSSPAIVGDKIFLTAVRDKEHLETLCLDRAKGKILWRVEAPHKTLEQIHGIGSYAQPSPAADTECVVAMFGSSGLYCYDHAGKELWHRELGPFVDEFGTASSPIIGGDRVVLARDHDLGSFIAAYDKQTGKELWRVERSEFGRSYSTPVIWTVDGKRQIVLAGSLRVVGYEWETGRELWTVRGISRVVCSTPVIGDGNRLLVAAWSAGGEPGDMIRMEPFADFAAQFDENKNGTLEKAEVGNSAALKTRFSQCDRNKDGQITKTEYDNFAMLFDRSQNGLLAIKPGCSGDASESNLLWRYDKFIPYCASPLSCGERVFMIKDGGILTCVSAATGKATKSGRMGATGNYYASPVAGDGKVFLLSQKGMLSVVSNVDQWQVLHSVDFGEECYATPALLDGHIYLRTAGHLYCFGTNALAAR